MATRILRPLCLALCLTGVLLLPAHESLVGAPNQPKKKESADARSRLGDKDIVRIVKQAGRSATAKEAFEMLDTLLKGGVLSDDHLDELRAAAKLWEERAAKDLVRNGTEWVTKSENDSRIKQADTLIQEAVALIQVGNHKEAKKALVRASNVDKCGILPDFLLGLLNGPFFADDPDQARKYFERVLQRVPGHAATLNNLALAEVRDRHFATALKRWQEAGQNAPLSPELPHNLAKLLAEAKDGLLKPTASELNSFGKLYASLAVLGNKQANEQVGGWRYMLADLPRSEQNRGRFDKGDTVAQFATATGFVVHNRHILTNRHVVEDADALKLEIETKSGPRVFSGSIVAISSKFDLALIKAPDCDIAPLELSLDAQPRGTDIMILGYPVSQILGKTIKSTRGTVSGGNGREMLLFDAAANPGNSGGPVCDKRGNVVAVLTSRYEL
ncbi:MAG TPA: trypsin-like peptidase domain-containing protein, partial [Planctomycetaceae bacterium]